MYDIKLCSIDNQMILEWRKEFITYPKIEIIREDMFNQKADAIVSPGNSFGLMDAGIDKLVNEYFSHSIETKLQEIIKTKYYGELSVGNAIIIKTDDDKFPYFISSPTMRVPMRLKESVNVYLATRAIFITINKFNKTNNDKINSVIIPGMGVGSGKMPYDVAAMQMKKAYESIILNKIDFPEDWKQAIQYHKNLRNNI